MRQSAPAACAVYTWMCFTGDIFCSSLILLSLWFFSFSPSLFSLFLLSTTSFKPSDPVLPLFSLSHLFSYNNTIFVFSPSLSLFYFQKACFPFFTISWLPPPFLLSFFLLPSTISSLIYRLSPFFQLSSCFLIPRLFGIYRQRITRDKREAQINGQAETSSETISVATQFSIASGHGISSSSYARSSRPSLISFASL